MQCTTWQMLTSCCHFITRALMIPNSQTTDVFCLLLVGDWFKVANLVKESGGDDTQMVNAWNKIGQYYSDRHKWLKAAQYYMQVNSEQSCLCFKKRWRAPRSSLALAEHERCAIFNTASFKA